MIELLLFIAGVLVLVNSRLWSNGYWQKYGKYGQWISGKLSK